MYGRLQEIALILSLDCTTSIYYSLCLIVLVNLIRNLHSSEGTFLAILGSLPFLVIYVPFVNVSSTVKMGEIYCISRVVLLCVQCEYLFFLNYYENINLVQKITIFKQNIWLIE